MASRPYAPVDPEAYRAAIERRLPAVDRLGEFTWSIPLRLSSDLVAHSFCYVILDAEGAVHLIDPGWDSDDNLRLIETGLARAGVALGDVRTIIATHLHPDHLGMAGRLRTLTGAPIVLHRAEQEAMDRPPAMIGDDDLDRWGVPEDRREELRALPKNGGRDPGVRADLLVEDGDLLPVPGRELRVLWTPGHTPGHICIDDPVELNLFTGDHVLPLINPGIGRGGMVPTNPLADYLTALQRLESLDDRVAAPGHGYRFRGLAERCRAIAAHHRRRTDEIAEVLAESPQATVWGAARQVGWTAGWESLGGYLLGSALSQTAMHLDLLTLSAHQS